MRALSKLSWLIALLSPMVLPSLTAPSFAGNPPVSGDAAIEFKAQTMSGKDVSFPADYKGKLVILDFWATWCGPCMREVPGLVKSYEQFHPRGVEILGVTLDKADSADRVKKVTADKKMTWEQVYDGKFWQARVAQMYSINSIPHAFLIDGDTGKIIAEGKSLRGEALAATLEAALKNKAAASATAK